MSTRSSRDIGRPEAEEIGENDLAAIEKASLLRILLTVVVFKPTRRRLPFMKDGYKQNKQCDLTGGTESAVGVVNK
ncbi:hypothetical protein BC937DRAFT_88696 [Endogone sp. FLAS-F59071]|nr:hypothetical protein BC937DRAFT_88696 [Endogone sp. FLAS-F59071]|eukprot:RUS18506.1 hypothetical protein BC937DRAFT_88696 [Endogone sp. FLAS-F59071]